jgi:hypothetical protein
MSRLFFKLLDSWRFETSDADVGRRLVFSDTEDSYAVSRGSQSSVLHHLQRVLFLYFGQGTSFLGRRQALLVPDFLADSLENTGAIILKEVATGLVLVDRLAWQKFATVPLLHALVVDLFTLPTRVVDEWHARQRRALGYML